MNQTRQIAAGITFLVCTAILIWMLVAHLSYNPLVFSDEPDPYIAMEVVDEEFLEVEVLPQQRYDNEPAAPAQTETDMNNQSQPAPTSGRDLTTQGRVDNPVQNVTQSTPSPVTEKQKPTPSTPAASVENTREQEERATAQQTQNQVNNAFNNARNNALNGNRDDGNAGRTDGNPDSGAPPNATGSKIANVTGTVGGGWKLPAYSRKIPSNEVGTVTFEVVVNKDGSVGKITVSSNSGLSQATVSRCEAEIKKHKFTNTNPETAESTVARITFRIQDPT